MSCYADSNRTYFSAILFFCVLSARKAEESHLNLFRKQREALRDDLNLRIINTNLHGELISVEKDERYYYY